jgi:signal transduction histidine kinase
MLASADADPACTPEFVESGADRVEDALAGLARISTIVREVRAFAHAGQGERQLTDVNALLGSALHLAGLNRSGSGPVETNLAELPRIEISGQDLKQAFFGLAQWAFSRVAPGERVEVGTALLGERVVVVFELRTARTDRPGDSTHRAATGSIQLVIARQIVEQQGGELAVEEFEDGVTRIRASLPVESPLHDEAPPGGTLDGAASAAPGFAASGGDAA